MIKIKVSIAPSDKGFHRQIPNRGIVWNNCEFHINDDDFCEADFWVICYQYLPGGKETCRVAPDNTIFVTWEPDSVWHFTRGFLKQFGSVISCQRHLHHKNIVKDQPGLGWHIGMKNNGGFYEYNKDYDFFTTSNPTKTKLMSVISSSKTFTSGHKDRLDFVHKLKEHFGDRIDVFGRGIRDFDDKWDVIAPYKYHVCIENCSQPYYFSEKLSDAYLGNSFPFYYGCTNIDEFFSKDSFRIIDIHNPAQAIQTIEDAIVEDLAVKNKPAVDEAKMKVLNDYNFFELICKYVLKLNKDIPKENVVIKDVTHFDFGRKLYKLKYYFFDN